MRSLFAGPIRRDPPDVHNPTPLHLAAQLRPKTLDDSVHRRGGTHRERDPPVDRAMNEAPDYSSNPKSRHVIPSWKFENTRLHSPKVRLSLQTALIVPSNRVHEPLFGPQPIKVIVSPQTRMKIEDARLISPILWNEFLKKPRTAETNISSLGFILALHVGCSHWGGDRLGFANSIYTSPSFMSQQH